jgi:hypothetical protein
VEAFCCLEASRANVLSVRVLGRFPVSPTTHGSRCILPFVRAFVLFLLLLTTGIAAAQSELVGPGRFPETRGISALPGGGFGVLRNGRPSFNGAISFSTPIAYGLDNWHWAAGVNSISSNRKLRGIDTSSDEDVSSGTGFVMFGIPTEFGSITYSAMFISVHVDELTSNFHFTPKQKEGPVTWAIGVQDLGDTSGTTRPFERRSATSPYIVATGEPSEGVYASLGYGNQRFGGVFGNVSAPLTPDFKVLAEYDTYNWNLGTAFRLGKVGRGEATGFLGLVRGKYATWNVAVSF